MDRHRLPPSQRSEMMHSHRLAMKTDGTVVFMVLSSLAFPKTNPRTRIEWQASLRPTPAPRWLSVNFRLT
jgi:hypothetical protein